MQQKCKFGYGYHLLILISYGIAQSDHIRINTVKPVYKGHPWDSKKVAVVKRLRQSGRYSQFVPIKLLLVL